MSFLGTLGLLLATEAAARYYAPHYQSFSDALILYKKNVLESRALPPYQGLIMGDSEMLGVNATTVSDLITKRLGRPFSFYNFSFPEHGMEGYYLILEEYLRHHRAPEVIVFDITPFMLDGHWNLVHNTAPVSGRLHRFCLLFSLAQGAEVLPLDFFLSQFQIAKMERLSFLVTYRQHIQNYLETIMVRRPYAPLGNFMSGCNGGVRFGSPAPPGPELFKATIGNMKTTVSEDEALFWLRKFFALAQSRGIRVLLCVPPLERTIFEAERQGGFRHNLYGTIGDFVRDFPNLSTLEPWGEGYDRAFFVDAIHLNGKGNRVFSLELGQRIADALSSRPHGP